jgi:hypothetical protein
MEDRQPTGLMLEMIRPVAGDESAAARWQREEGIRSALASGVYERATSFRNLRYGAAIFPPKIDEPTHVTVYELTSPDVLDAFDRSETDLPKGNGEVMVNRGVFKRYPRPGQGVCTGNPLTGMYLILISPTERLRAQELRDWADFVHIHYIAASCPRGFTMITPYENARGEDPLFMHLYELETDDPGRSVDEMTPQVCEKWGFKLDFEDAAFKRWAVTDSLDIWYVNVFERVAL